MVTEKTEKLKTLKDLKHWKRKFKRTYIGEIPKEINVIDREELKQLAIKWVKDLDSTKLPVQQAVRGWIKHFFNITEDDLKEKKENG